MGRIFDTFSAARGNPAEPGPPARETAGGMPLEGSCEFSLNLDSYIVRNPSSTFFVKVEGDSMRETGIFSGDLLVIDRSVEPADGRIVLAVADGDFVVRRLKKTAGWTGLVAEGDARPIDIREDAGCYVWGVVVGAVHKL